MPTLDKSIIDPSDIQKAVNKGLWRVLSQMMASPKSDLHTEILDLITKGFKDDLRLPSIGLYPAGVVILYYSVLFDIEQSFIARKLPTLLAALFASEVLEELRTLPGVTKFLDEINSDMEAEKAKKAGK